MWGCCVNRYFIIGIGIFCEYGFIGCFNWCNGEIKVFIVFYEVFEVSVVIFCGICWIFDDMVSYESVCEFVKVVVILVMLLDSGIDSGSCISNVISDDNISFLF